MSLELLSGRAPDTLGLPTSLPLGLYRTSGHPGVEIGPQDKILHPKPEKTP